MHPGLHRVGELDPCAHVAAEDDVARGRRVGALLLHLRDRVVDHLEHPPVDVLLGIVRGVAVADVEGLLERDGPERVHEQRGVPCENELRDAVVLPLLAFLGPGHDVLRFLHHVRVRGVPERVRVLVGHLEPLELRVGVTVPVERVLLRPLGPPARRTPQVAVARVGRAEDLVAEPHQHPGQREIEAHRFRVVGILVDVQEAVTAGRRGQQQSQRRAARVSHESGHEFNPSRVCVRRSRSHVRSRRAGRS